jgi:hypothetical protein
MPLYNGGRTNQVLAHRDCALLAPQRLTILEIAEPGIRIHCDGGYKASGQAFEAVIKLTFHVLYPELLLPSQITTQAVKWPWNQIDPVYLVSTNPSISTF